MCKTYTIHGPNSTTLKYSMLTQKNLPTKQNSTISNYEKTTIFQKIKTFAILTPFRPKIPSMIE